jgi:hypothetical protein
MKISTTKGDYFISLPKPLYKGLKTISTQKDNINFDLLAILTHLILTNRYADKNFKDGKEWVHLSAQILRANYDTTKYKSSEHINFLIENEIIEMIPHYHNAKEKKGKSRGYRIHQNYFDTKENKHISLFDSAFQIIPISESGIKKKCLKRIQGRKQNANRIIGNLTNWLNSGKFEFDEASAIEFINSKYNEESGRKDKRMFHIKNFQASLQIYSMEGKDGRLHSSFTSLPTDLKQFVTFNGKKLKEADIKSSQPFILTIVLELIIKEYKKEIDRKGIITIKHFSKKITKLLYKYTDIRFNNVLSIYFMCYYITSIVLINIKDTDKEDINRFIFLIRNGDIYELVGKELLQSGAIWLENGVYYTKILKKDTEHQKIEDFETLRKCAKTITLNAIYCSPKTKAIRVVNEFRKLFPTVTKWLDALKKNNYSDLAILMQQIESKAVLLYATKEIIVKHPEMLLISRHDSLSTTEDYFDILHSEFKKLLSDYFGIEVEIGKEVW